MLMFKAAKRPRYSLMFLLMAMMLVFAGAVSAQVGVPGDDDGDGVPNRVDDCPDRPGPLANNGCPLDTDGDGVLDDVDQCVNTVGVPPNGCPAPPPDLGSRDGDGDGVTDDLDFCDQQPGPLENGGCPLPEATPLPAQPLPALPDSGACVAATSGYSAVNLREAPTILASIVGQLDPFSIYPVLMIFTTPEGDWLRTDGGWFAGYVTRLGGNCDSVPQITSGDINPTYLINFEEPPAFEPLAALPAVQMACDGSVHGFLFGEDFGEPEMDADGNCTFPLASGNQMMFQPGDSAPMWSLVGEDVEWSWQPMNSSNCPTALMLIEPAPDADGVPVVALLTMPDCLSDDALEQLPGDGDPLSQVLTPEVWTDLFTRVGNEPLPDDTTSPETDPPDSNFGFQTCDDLICATAVMTDLPLPGVLFYHLVDCVAITHETTYGVDFQINYLTTENTCPGGFLRGTTVEFETIVGPEVNEFYWGVGCMGVPETPGAWTGMIYGLGDPVSYTLDWSYMTDIKVHCRFSLIVDFND